MSLKDLKTWKGDFSDRQHVQPEDHKGALSGSFLSGESAVVVAGPAELDGTNVTSLLPVGLVQQAQISQNKQLNQVFEIGGRVPFYVPSRVSVQASLSRILFDGPSLFYALYARGEGDDETTVPPAPTFGSEVLKTANNPTAPYPSEGVVSRVRGEGQEQNDPGLFWSNLGSGIFNRPLGLGFVLFDMEGQAYGGCYLEKCYVQSHRFGISANSTVLAENVSLVATRLKPINAKVLG